MFTPALIRRALCAHAIALGVITALVCALAIWISRIEQNPGFWMIDARRIALWCLLGVWMMHVLITTVAVISFARNAVVVSMIHLLMILLWPTLANAVRSGGWVGRAIYWLMTPFVWMFKG